MSRLKAAFLCAVCVLGLGGCIEHIRMSILDDSNPDRPVFSLHGRGKKGQVRVDSVELTPCPERARAAAVWFAGVAEYDEGPLSDKVAYGELLPGLRTYQPPQKLVPGCYILQVWEQNPEEHPKVGELIFTVDQKGRLSPMSPSSFKKAYPEDKSPATAPFKPKT